MSGINGLHSGYGNYGNYGNYAAARHTSQALSSGKKINKAADGAAELAVLQKQDALVRGYQAGTGNLQSGKSALNIADGAMSGVADSLQRIRELAVKASNGLYGADDKQYMQAEIDQLKQGIGEIASNTSYNENKLLDGSMSDKVIISDSEGTSLSFSTPDSALSALGIEDFDVTGDFDISAIDSALQKIGAGRASVGAQSNTFDYAINYNGVAEYNTVSAQSKLGDTEYGEYVSKMQKENLLQTYRVMMQRNQMEQRRQNTLGLFH